jgi:hypothetical protein
MGGQSSGALRAVAAALRVKLHLAALLQREESFGTQVADLIHAGRLSTPTVDKSVGWHGAGAARGPSTAAPERLGDFLVKLK